MFTLSLHPCLSNSAYVLLDFLLRKGTFAIYVEKGDIDGCKICIIHTRIITDSGRKENRKQALSIYDKTRMKTGH